MTSSPPKRILGMRPGDIAKGALTFLVGVLGTVFVAWWNAKEPHLTVSVAPPVQFSGKTNAIAVFFATVENDGRKEAEAVECQLLPNGVQVQELMVTPANLNAQIVHRDGNTFITVSVLNVGETLSISAYQSTADTKTPTPHLVVRAKGLLGETKRPPSIFEFHHLIYAFTVGSVLTSCVWIIFGHTLVLRPLLAELREVDARSDAIRDRQERLATSVELERAEIAAVAKSVTELSSAVAFAKARAASSGDLNVVDEPPS